MVACIPITQEQIRAEVWMVTGGTRVLLAKTPFVQSFNVSKSRGQLTTTFSVGFEMLAGTVFPLGADLQIKAGVRGNLKTVFTGFIEQASSEPAFGKPSYFSVSMSGRGVLSLLEKKKFTRRLLSNGQGMFCLITGGSANRPSAVNSLDKTKSSGNHLVPVGSPNPAAAGGNGSGEQSPYVVSVNSENNQAAGGIAERLSGPPAPSDQTNSGSGSGGLGVHTHEDLDNGGPAFGVYSAD